jgi:hypothetical protein
MNIEITTHPNATFSKFKNARVQVIELDNEDYAIVLKILSDKENSNEPRASHKVEKNKIVTTSLKISKEGALSLCVCLISELKKIGIEFKK